MPGRDRSLSAERARRRVQPVPPTRRQLCASWGRWQRAALCRSRLRPGQRLHALQCARGAAWLLSPGLRPAQRRSASRRKVPSVCARAGSRAGSSGSSGSRAVSVAAAAKPAESFTLLTWNLWCAAGVQAEMLCLGRANAADAAQPTPMRQSAHMLLWTSSTSRPPTLCASRCASAGQVADALHRLE